MLMKSFRNWNKCLHTWTIVIWFLMLDYVPSWLRVTQIVNHNLVSNGFHWIDSRIFLAKNTSSMLISSNFYVSNANLCSPYANKSVLSSSKISNLEIILAQLLGTTKLVFCVTSANLHLSIRAESMRHCSIIKCTNSTRNSTHGLNWGQCFDNWLIKQITWVYNFIGWQFNKSMTFPIFCASNSVE